MFRKVPARLFGILSVALTAEFWVHFAVPHLRENVPFLFWPEGVFAQLLLAGLTGGIAGCKGSRWWLLVAAIPILTLVLLYAIEID